MKLRNSLMTLAVGLTVVAAACSSGTSTTTTADQPTTSSSTTTVTTPQTTTTIPSDQRTFVGADGVETTIADVSRIVSLNGDLTEIIFELGFGENVVVVWGVVTVVVVDDVVG